LLLSAPVKFYPENGYLVGGNQVSWDLFMSY